MILINKILVTGAAGLVGHAVCQLLKTQKLPFVAFYRDEPTQNLGWDYVCGDITRCDMQGILSLHNISSIVHCAAAIPNEKNSFSACYQINAAIDKNIAEYLVATAIPKLVYISTTNLYGISGEIITESSAVNIENMYSQAKLESEQMFSSINSTAAVLLRINAPYHYTQTSDTVLKIFINKALAGEDILYHGTGRRQQDFTHVSDIAAAVLGALKAEKTGIYNIAAGNPVSMKNLAALILSKVPQSKSKIIPSGLPDAQENHKALFNINKAKNYLHWKPVIKLDAGIEEWIKYLQQ
jgi:UDP-glucose 4-epimerase